MEGIHESDLQLRSEPQARETLFPALPDAHGEEETVPHLVEDHFVEV
jgi:hypothetical protein